MKDRRLLMKFMKEAKICIVEEGQYNSIPITFYRNWSIVYYSAKYNRLSNWKPNRSRGVVSGWNTVFKTIWIRYDE